MNDTARLLSSIIISSLTTISICAEDPQPSAADADSVYRQNLEEVVVTGTRQQTDVRHLPMTLTIINRETLTRQNQPSILPTLSSYVPGLFVTSRGMMGYGVSNGAAGGISIRGVSGTAAQVMVLVDGQPQYNGIYGHPIADNYQTMYAERVEVLRQPASVLYGSNAMGGVVNIVTRNTFTKKHQTDAVVGAGSYGTVQAEASYAYHGSRLSANVAAQYMRSDNHRPNMGFEQYGGFTKLGYSFSSHWESTIDFNITRSISSYPGAENAPMNEADQWITRGFASVGVRNTYEKFSGGASVYTSFGWHKINDGYRADQPSASPQTRLFQSSDALVGVSAYENYNYCPGGRLTLGIDYQHIYGHAYYTNRETGEEIATQNKQSGKAHNNETAAYANISQDIFRWLTINCGIRLDHHTVTGTEWIPQAGIAIRPTSDSDIKLSLAKGFRNPTMREMYLYPPSNEELRPERLMNYEIAWHHRPNNGSFSYGINLFLIKGDNIIQTVERKNVNTGEINNKGIEVEATWNATKHLTFTTNHSFLNMKHHVLAAPEYKGFVAAGYTTARWSAGLQLQQLAGLFTAVGENERKECATLLSAHASVRLCKTVQLWARGENLLAQRYEIIEGYPMPRATFMAGVKCSF
ncbi:MAG: TonB-dependent receptor [Bacteroidaceae bacterium]|nr:TonB-dependent receptor [Bacteroidaceae bacterium]